MRKGDQFCRYRVLLVGVVSLLLLPAATAWAEHHEEAPARPAQHEWDREAVTALARELVDLLEHGAEVGRNRPEQPTVLQQRQVDAAQGAVRRSRESARVYAEKMDSGATRGESDFYFRTVREHLRAAVQTAGDAEPTPEVARVLVRLRAIGAELERLHKLP